MSEVCSTFGCSKFIIQHWDKRFITRQVAKLHVYTPFKTFYWGIIKIIKIILTLNAGCFVDLQFLSQIYIIIHALIKRSMLWNWTVPKLIWSHIQITHSWDLFSNLFSPILQFIFFKFCLFNFFAWSKVGRIIKSVSSTIYKLFRTRLKKIKQKQNKQNLEKINWRIGENRFEKRSHEWVIYL